MYWLKLLCVCVCFSGLISVCPIERPDSKVKVKFSPEQSMKSQKVVEE